MNKKFNLAIPKIRIYQILFPSDSCETFQMALKFVLFFFILVRSNCHHRRVLTLYFSTHTYSVCQSEKYILSKVTQKYRVGCCVSVGRYGINCKGDRSCQRECGKINGSNDNAEATLEFVRLKWGWILTAESHPTSPIHIPLHRIILNDWASECAKRCEAKNIGKWKQLKLIREFRE